MMLKAFTTGLGVLLLAAVACANDLPAGDVLQEEYRLNNERIDRIFRDKVRKISERPSLPQEMRDLLMKQADEVRDFDAKTLKDKMDMKIRHARERDLLKERLRHDAENRVQWLVDEEERFQRAQDAKQREDEERAAALKSVEKAEKNETEAQKTDDQSEKTEGENVAAKQPEDAVKQPEDTAKQPEDAVKQPEEDTAKQPEDAVKQPEEDAAKQPEDAAKQPEDAVKQPEEDAAKQPEDAAKQPEEDTAKQSAPIAETPASPE